MKTILYLIIFCFLLNPTYGSMTNSNNSFEIELKQVPSGSSGSNSHKKLSDGAITAIALGSVFGGLGVLSGIGYYFFKHSSALSSGFACGINCPYQIISLDNPQIITKSSNIYLIEAYKHTKKAKEQKFLLIPDTTVNPNTYNTVFFEIPEEFKNSQFEIIQASGSFVLKDRIPQLDSDIFINPKDKNPIKIPTSSVQINPEGGILIKKGRLTNQENRILALTTTYMAKNKSEQPKIYAIIVSFSSVNQ